MNMNQPIAGSPTITEKFAEAKRRQHLTFPVFIAIVVTLIYADDSEKITILGFPKDIVMLVSSVVLLGIVLFSLKNWRCPGCNGYLGKSINPKFCPKCGVKLQAGAA